jgi:VanZ family protein
MTKIGRYIPAILWMCLIFFLSARPEVGHDQFYWWIFVARKLAHVTEYFVLTILLYYAFGYRRLSTAIFISILYAFSDETHQLFVPGRVGSLVDVAIDSFGVFLSLIVIKYTPWRKLSLIPR